MLCTAVINGFLMNLICNRSPNAGGCNCFTYWCSGNWHYLIFRMFAKRDFQGLAVPVPAAGQYITVVVAINEQRWSVHDGCDCRWTINTGGEMLMSRAWGGRCNLIWWSFVTRLILWAGLLIFSANNCLLLNKKLTCVPGEPYYTQSFEDSIIEIHSN